MLDVLCPRTTLVRFSKTETDEMHTVRTFHSRIVLSSDPEAMVAPSGLHDIVDIPARCPSKVCINFPVFAPQTFTAPSAPTPS